MPAKRFALIGPGKVGIAFAYLLRQRGYDLRIVVGRSESSLERAAAYLRGGAGTVPVLTDDLALLPANLDFLLLGVKDGEIAGMVRNLWLRRLLRPGQTVFHFSGALPADIGHTAEMTEIGCAAIHPLQACADVEAGICRLPSAVWSLEGDPLGLMLGEELLHAVPVRWFTVQREQKPLYHAAAALASNYLVTLIKTAVDFLMRVGIPAELAQAALLPLVQGTIENLREKKPEDALTGAIARGDVRTVAAHLQALAETGESEWVELYSILGKATTAFAPIDPETRSQLNHLLKIAVTPEILYTETENNSEKKEVL